MGRLEADWPRRLAINVLGNGLSEAGHDDDALSVGEAELAMMRRLGDSESNILAVQSNLAGTYEALGRLDESLRLRKDVYSRTLKLLGKEHAETLLEANNYAGCLLCLQHFGEARSLLLKTMPLSRRVLGRSNEITLRLSWNYARALCNDPDATLDDVREAVATLEDADQIARRVLGGAHPLAQGTEVELQNAQALLRAREAPPPENA